MLNSIKCSYLATHLIIVLSHFYQAFLLSYTSHYNAKSSLILTLAYGIKTLGICTTITQTESTTASLWW